MRIMVLMAALGLAGCGIADHFNAQGRMEKSEQEYRACLSKHIESPAVCQPLKDVWEADRKAYFAGQS